MTPGQAEHAGDELTRARTALREASALVDLELFDGAASRLYYASFHAARAALAARGEAVKTHAGQVNRFTETFGPNPLLGRLLQLRARADYGGGVSESVTALRGLIDQVAAFIAMCDRFVADEGTHELEPDPPPDL